VNPFDLKAALLAKHAQHVVLIHFPIALLLVGVAFDAAARWWTERQALAAAAYYNLSVAAVSALPVVATGLLAWQFQLGGHRLRGTLLLHLVLGLASSATIWWVWWLHWHARRTGQAPPAYRWPLELLAVALVTMTGHLGGFLSGVNAPG